jgi:hypothetical protein
VDSHYLLDAKTEGRIVRLRFYHAQTGKIHEIVDADYKPYFFLPHPLSQTDEEGVRSLYGEIASAKRRDLVTDELKELTKVTVYTLDAFKKAAKIFPTAWETEIDYAQSYIYDHNLVFGAPYTIQNNQTTLAANISLELENRFQQTFGAIKTIDPQKYAQIKHWFSLIQQPTPQLTPE